MSSSLFDDILAVLPQTQCGQCGFPGCAPYAKAIATKKAAINLCPPGGDQVLNQLASLTQQDSEPLRSALHEKLTPTHVVKIREAECIGCMKCLRACPVDAIFGANKQMHVVIADQCTGCDLCIEPCPMDCIDKMAVPELKYDAQEARRKYEAKLLRHDFKRVGISLDVPSIENQAVVDKKAFIAAAVARAKAKKLM